MNTNRLPPLNSLKAWGAPEASMHAAVGLTAYRSEVAAIEAPFQAMNAGADAVNTLHSQPMVTKRGCTNGRPGCC